MRQTKTRRPRGWMMLAVIFVLLALSLAVTAFYTQAEDHAYLGTAMNAHSLAAVRAEQGAQDALARVRSGALMVETLNASTVTCGGPDPWTTCTNMLGPVTVDNGPTLDVREGGGLQYRYIVYRPSDVGAPANLYTIRAIGFVGYSPTSASLYTSEVELTVQKGTTSGTLRTQDDYGNVVSN